MARSTTFAVLALLASPFLLTGCIVGEIRDSLQTANKQLTDVQTTLEKLDSTNEQLAHTNAELTRTAELISGVQAGLGRIDATNASLGNVDQRLALLQSINNSLSHLDVHLTSLRKTIGRIDSAIPFFDLGGDEPAPEDPTAPIDADLAAATTEPPPADGAATTTPPATQPTPAAQATPDAAAAPAPSTTATTTDPAAPPAAKPASSSPAREPLLGAWISRYPDDRTALILLANGRFTLATRHQETADGNPNIHERAGSWKRQDNALLLEGDARPETTPDGKEVDASTRDTLEVVMIAGRSATIRLNGQLMIITRP